MVSAVTMLLLSCVRAVACVSVISACSYLGIVWAKTHMLCLFIALFSQVVKGKGDALITLPDFGIPVIF